MAESLHGLRLSRFYNYEQDIYLPAPLGGWNPDANPWELPENQASTLENLIIRPGKVVVRGPLNLFANLTLAPLSGNYGLAGGLITDSTTPLTNPSGQVIMTPHAQGSNRVEPWAAPLVGAASASLASAKAQVDSVAIDTVNTKSNTTGTLDQTMGPRWINFDGLMYGISYDSAGAVVTDTNGNYHMKPLSLLTYPATTASNPGTVTLPTVLANAPHGAFDLKGYLSRIWMLGGVDTPGGLTVHEPTTLYYTNPGVSGVGTASADWKDPVSGLVNKIRMDNNTADYGMGLAAVPNAMVIFRRNSIWILRGTTSASFQLQVISKEVGCLDPRSIVETDHGVYFMSSRGLMLTDGVSVVNVSGPVSQNLRSAITIVTSTFVLQNRGAWIQATRLSEGHILISIGEWFSTASNGWAPSPFWSGLYDPATNAWTRITSNFWHEPVPPAGGAFGSPDTCMPLIARPEREQTITIGLNAGVLVENNRTTAISQTILTNSETPYDTDLTALVGPGAKIPAYWKTRLIPMVAGIRRLAIAKRYFLDYLFTCQNGIPASGWSIQPNDGLGNAVDTVSSTPAVNGALSFPIISRFSHDLTSELTDLYFDITFNATYPGFPPLDSMMELYGIGLEFQRTRDAR